MTALRIPTFVEYRDGYGDWLQSPVFDDEDAARAWVIAEFGPSVLDDETVVLTPTFDPADGDA